MNRYELKNLTLSNLPRWLNDPQFSVKIIYKATKIVTRSLSRGHSYTQIIIAATNGPISYDSIRAAFLHCQPVFIWTDKQG